MKQGSKHFHSGLKRLLGVAAMAIFSADGNRWAARLPSSIEDKPAWYMRLAYVGKRSDSIGFKQTHPSQCIFSHLWWKYSLVSHKSISQDYFPGVWTMLIVLGELTCIHQILRCKDCIVPSQLLEPCSLRPSVHRTPLCSSPLTSKGLV